MKLNRLTFALLSVLFFAVVSAHAQSEITPHATFSAFTVAPHSGVIYKIDSITTYGACATVRYNEIRIPGFHTQATVDYEEHLSIPIIGEEIQYFDSVNQFDEPIAAIFDWQGKIFESTPCPIQYFAPPPSFLLYQARGAHPMINTSNRAQVDPENPGIAGFVLNEPSWVIIRGIGSSMNLEASCVRDPIITLHSDTYLLDDFNDDLENSIFNDNWQDTLRKETLEFWKIAPANPKEAALVTYLNPGAYTAHIESREETGQGLVEVFVIPYALPDPDIAEQE